MTLPFSHDLGENDSIVLFRNKKSECIHNSSTNLHFSRNQSWLQILALKSSDIVYLIRKKKEMKGGA